MIENDSAYIEAYIKSMQSLCPDILNEHVNEFRKQLILKKYQKKEKIFDLDDYHKYVVYINKGLVRSYYINKKGEDISAWFSAENDFVTDYPSFLTGAKSNYIFECLEPTTALLLPKVAIEENYEKYPSIQKYGRLIAEEILKLQHSRIESFLFKSPKERYLNMLECSTPLLSRISVTHLSSYLGVKRQSLTRIRKELHSKK